MTSKRITWELEFDKRFNDLLSVRTLRGVKMPDTADRVKEFIHKLLNKKFLADEIQIEQAIYSYYANSLPPNKNEIRDTRGLARAICKLRRY